MAKRTVSTGAQNLDQDSIVVVLHVDPIIQQALFGYHLSDEHDPTWKPPKRRWLFNSVQSVTKLQKLHCPCFNHIDIPRMLKGGYTFGAFGIHSHVLNLSNRCRSIGYPPQLTCFTLLETRFAGILVPRISAFPKKITKF